MRHKRCTLLLAGTILVGSLGSAAFADAWNNGLDYQQTRAKEQAIAQKDCTWKLKGTLVFVNTVPLNCNPAHDFKLYHQGLISGALNDTQSYRRVAWAYENGYGVAKSPKNAYMWYKMIAGAKESQAWKTYGPKVLQLTKEFSKSQLALLNQKTVKLSNKINTAYQAQFQKEMYGGE